MACRVHDAHRVYVHRPWLDTRREQHVTLHRRRYDDAKQRRSRTFESRDQDLGGERGAQSLLFGMGSRFTAVAAEHPVFRGLAPRRARRGQRAETAEGRAGDGQSWSGVRTTRSTIPLNGNEIKPVPDEATGAPTCMGYDPGMLTRFRQTAACTVLPLVLALSCATGNPQSNRPGATAATPPVQANTASRDIRVRDVTPEYGNIDTDFNQDGIVELGIRPWETFAVSAGDKRVTIRFAST